MMTRENDIENPIYLHENRCGPLFSVKFLIRKFWLVSETMVQVSVPWMLTLVMSVNSEPWRLQDSSSWNHAPHYQNHSKPSSMNYILSQKTWHLRPFPIFFQHNYITLQSFIRHASILRFGQRFYPFIRYASPSF